MSARPRIAVIMDENTSVDGTHYDMTKNYFVAIQRAGGMPFGIPYFMDMVEAVAIEFDGFVNVGGRFAFPDAWFLEGQASKAPRSERLAVELGLMRGFLDRDKPVLGICNGMQMLACLHGGRMVHEVRKPDSAPCSPRARPCRESRRRGAAAAARRPRRPRPAKGWSGRAAR